LLPAADALLFVLVGVLDVVLADARIFLLSALGFLGSRLLLF
jgi:hypothetical protein